MIILKTNFNKSSGNSKEETSSTMKVVDQESIRQRNSKPISRETQSNQHKHSKSVGKKKKSNQHKRIQTVSSKCCRIPIENCNPTKILKWTEKSNADFIPSNINRKHLNFITGLGASMEVQMGQERHNFTFIEPKITWRKIQR